MGKSGRVAKHSGVGGSRAACKEPLPLLPALAVQQGPATLPASNPADAVLPHAQTRWSTAPAAAAAASGASAAPLLGLQTTLFLDGVLPMGWAVLGCRCCWTAAAAGPPPLLLGCRCCLGCPSRLASNQSHLVAVLLLSLPLLALAVHAPA